MDLCDLCVVAYVAQHHMLICHVFSGLLAVAVCILRPLAAARRTPPAATLLPLLLLLLLLLLFKPQIGLNPASLIE